MNALKSVLAVCLASSAALVASGDAIAQTPETPFSESTHTSANSALLGPTQATNIYMFSAIGGSNDFDNPDSTTGPIVTLPQPQPSPFGMTQAGSGLSVRSGYDVLVGRGVAVVPSIFPQTYQLPSGVGGFGSSASLLHQGPSVQFVFEF
jgi:hypothetical protein